MKGARATQKTVPARLMPAAEFARSQAPHRRAVVHEEMSGGVYVLISTACWHNAHAPTVTYVGDHVWRKAHGTHSDVIGRSAIERRIYTGLRVIVNDACVK